MADFFGKSPCFFTANDDDSPAFSGFLLTVFSRLDDLGNLSTMEITNLDDPPDGLVLKESIGYNDLMKW